MIVRCESLGEPITGLDILLVEDNPEDIAYVEQLTSRTQEAIRLAAVTGGEEALEYLSRRRDATGGPADAPPELIFLDVGLPGIDGIEVLRRIKSDEKLQEVPVIMLTGVEADRCVRDGQETGAHSHVVKPMSLQQFIWIIKSIRNYRRRIERLP